MRIQSTVVAVAFALALIAPSPIVAQECGGDNPRWLLVTIVGTTQVMRDERGGVSTNYIPFGDSSGSAFIKVCDIKDVGTDVYGRTLLERRSARPRGNLLQSYTVLKESPSEICAALPTCSDATAHGEVR